MQANLDKGPLSLKFGCEGQQPRANSRGGGARLGANPRGTTGGRQPSRSPNRAAGGRQPSRSPNRAPAAKPQPFAQMGGMMNQVNNSASSGTDNFDPSRVIKLI